MRKLSKNDELIEDAIMWAIQYVPGDVICFDSLDDLEKQYFILDDQVCYFTPIVGFKEAKTRAIKNLHSLAKDGFSAYKGKKMHVKARY